MRYSPWEACVYRALAEGVKPGRTEPTSPWNPREYPTVLWITWGSRPVRCTVLDEIASNRSWLLKKASLFRRGCHLRDVPQRVHLFQRRLGRRLTALGEQVLDDREALLEAQCRIDERLLGI